MKAGEFERRYAERSKGITVAQLRALGRVVVKCDCGDELCQGWASLPRGIAEDYIENLPGTYGYRSPREDEW